MKGIVIKYIDNKNSNISLFNFAGFKNFFYLLGFDYVYNLKENYYNECIKIIKNYNIKYLIVSAPPFSLFFLIKKIRSHFKDLIVILDYRDGWSSRINNLVLSPLKFIIKVFFEKKILRYSNYIMTSTANIHKEIKSFFKDFTKVLLVRNGFLTIPKNKKKNNKKIIIGYFGLLSDVPSSYRNIRVIYDAVSKNNLLKNKFVFEFYGNNFIKDKNIRYFKSFRFKNNLDYNKALSKMTQMDYLLILHTESSTAKEMVTTKFYDYLSSRTHIINISSGNTEVGKIIDRHKLGYNINYDKIDISSFLHKINKPKNKLQWLNKYNIFSRDYQNKKLVKIINKL